MSKSYVLGVDTGKHFAASLVSHEDGAGKTLEGVYYQHEEAFKRSDVKEIARSVVQMCVDAGADLSEVDLAVELPSHRYFGRSNSSALLRIFWQGLNLMRYLSGIVRRVITVPADEWNQQRDDKQKKMIFEQDFAPQFKSVEYYQNKHGSRSNCHERDACLLASFIIDRIRMGLSLKFD